jgi:hypothetical protein
MIKLKGVANKIFLLDEVGQFPAHYKKQFEQSIGWYAEPLIKLKKDFSVIKPRKEIIKPSLKYLNTLPKAYEIYFMLFGEPKTHIEWADRFNKVGEINKILMKNPQE